MFTKVCGLRSRDQIDWAVELGYTAAGIVLHPESLRYCGPREARELAAHGRGRIMTVAVGVSFDEVTEVYDDFDLVQIYRYQKLDRLILAGESIPAEAQYRYFLYDTSRGSGKAETLPPWLADIRDRLIISGGLTPDSVGPVIRNFRPSGVDVSSGVETERGWKDRRLMQKFIQEVNDATR